MSYVCLLLNLAVFNCLGKASKRPFSKHWTKCWPIFPWTKETSDGSFPSASSFNPTSFPEPFLWPASKLGKTPWERGCVQPYKTEVGGATAFQLWNTNSKFPIFSNLGKNKAYFEKLRWLSVWTIEKAGGRRAGSGRERGGALSFSLPDPARSWSRLPPARFFDRLHWMRAWNRQALTKWSGKAYGWSYRKFRKVETRAIGLSQKLLRIQRLLLFFSINLP